MLVTDQSEILGGKRTPHFPNVPKVDPLFLPYWFQNSNINIIKISEIHGLNVLKTHAAEPSQFSLFSHFCHFWQKAQKKGICAAWVFIRVRSISSLDQNSNIAVV